MTTKRFSKNEDEDLKDLLEVIFNGSGLPKFRYKIVSDNKLKTPIHFKILSEEVGVLADCDIEVLVNDEIFTILQDNSKSAVIERALAYIAFDSKKDSFVRNEADVIEHQYILDKYTPNVINALVLEVQQIKDMLDERKQEEKESKKTKKKR